jgi:FAD:protein FMN transferase
MLVNFGGDLRANRAPAGREGWHVGVEAWASGAQGQAQAAGSILLTQGACATSGDKHRHLMHQGRRYGHILDPRIGWPVPDAPLSATVLAPTCTDAGLLSTMAMLMGAEAEKFLATQDVAHWVMREG